MFLYSLFRYIIHSAVLIYNLHQFLELLTPICRQFVSIHKLCIPPHPVPKQLFFQTVFRWPPVMLFHESHHLVILDLPTFVLGHIKMEEVRWKKDDVFLFLWKAAPPFGVRDVYYCWSNNCTVTTCPSISPKPILFLYIIDLLFTSALNFRFSSVSIAYSVKP